MRAEEIVGIVHRLEQSMETLFKFFKQHPRNRYTKFTGTRYAHMGASGVDIANIIRELSWENAEHLDNSDLEKLAVCVQKLIRLRNTLVSVRCPSEHRISVELAISQSKYLLSQYCWYN